MANTVFQQVEISRIGPHTSYTGPAQCSELKLIMIHYTLIQPKAQVRKYLWLELFFAACYSQVK